MYGKLSNLLCLSRKPFVDKVASYLSTRGLKDVAILLDPNQLKKEILSFDTPLKVTENEDFTSILNVDSKKDKISYSLLKHHNNIYDELESLAEAIECGIKLQRCIQNQLNELVNESKQLLQEYLKSSGKEDQVSSFSSDDESIGSQEGFPIPSVTLNKKILKELLEVSLSNGDIKGNYKGISCVPLMKLNKDIAFQRKPEDVESWMVQAKRNLCTNQTENETRKTAAVLCNNENVEQKGLDEKATADVKEIGSKTKEEAEISSKKVQKQTSKRSRSKRKKMLRCRMTKQHQNYINMKKQILVEPIPCQPPPLSNLKLNDFIHSPLDMQNMFCKGDFIKKEPKNIPKPIFNEILKNNDLAENDYDVLTFLQREPKAPKPKDEFEEKMKELEEKLAVPDTASLISTDSVSNTCNLETIENSCNFPGSDRNSS